MLNTKKTNSRNMILWGGVAFLVIAGVIVLSLSLSGRSSDENAQDDVNVVYTNAAETVAAQQLTLAASQPSATPTLSVISTPTATLAPATPTLAISSPFPTNTTSVTTGGCDNSVYVADVNVISLSGRNRHKYPLNPCLPLARDVVVKIRKQPSVERINSRL